METDRFKDLVYFNFLCTLAIMGIILAPSNIDVLVGLISVIALIGALNEASERAEDQSSS